MSRGSSPCPEGCICGRHNRKYADLVGKTYDRLTVVAFDGYDTNGARCWLCVCECGNEISVRTAQLNNRGTRSCGCLRNETTVTNSRGRAVARRQIKGPHWYRYNNNGGYVVLTTTLSLTLAEEARAAGVKGISINRVHGSAQHRIMEHRLVAEIENGPLMTYETVHHMNGDRSDNRPENLEIRHKHQHPAGQKVSDLHKEIDRLKAENAELRARTLRHNPR